MYKYRRLTTEELESLKDSFIRFLAAQSITGEDWVRIKKNEVDRANDLIDKYSDIVIEKTIHNVKILEQRTNRRIVFYEFLADSARLIGVEFEVDIPLDLSGEFYWSQFVEVFNNEEYSAKILSGEKKYLLGRSKEIFDVMEQGARIVQDENIFNSMLKILDN
jgi:hypothetical protein